MGEFCLTVASPEEPAGDGEAVDLDAVVAEVYAARARSLTPQSVRELCQRRVRERMRQAKARQGVMEL